MKIKSRLTKQLLTLTKALAPLSLALTLAVPTTLLLAAELTVYTFEDLITEIDKEYTGDITLQLITDISCNTDFDINSGTNVTILGDVAEGEALNGYNEDYSAIEGNFADQGLEVFNTYFYITDAVFNEVQYVNIQVYFENSTVSITNSIFNACSYKMYGSGGGVFRNYGSDAELTIEGSYFSNNSSYDYGGVLCNETGATCYISDSIFINNSTTGTRSYPGGGAIANCYSSILNIENTLFSNNSSTSEGGAISNLSSTLTVEKSDFSLNTADTDGGAISSSTKGEVTISYSTFTENSSSNKGGAIANDMQSTLKISNSTFTSNEASQGGAFYNNYMGSITIEDSTIESNQADSGGAIYNTLLSKIYVYDSTFSDNIANDYGGAIYNTYGTYGTTKYASYAYIYDTSFIGNEAGIAGGAIYNDYSYLYIYAEEADVTFSGNTAGESGGAIYNVEGIVYLYAQTADIIFSGNTANGVSNAITQASDSITKLYAYSDTEGEGRIVFDDAITGAGTLSINTSTGARGTVVLNADMSGFTGSTTFYWGTLSVGADMGVDESTGYTNFFGGTFTTGNSSYSYSATIDAANGVLDCFDTSQWTTNTELSVCIDVSIENLSADFFDLTGDSLDINISELNILDEALVTEIKIAVADANEGFSLSADQYEIVTDNYTYTITDEYMDGTYYLIMSSTENIPEPSTATLSLLALAALCARRKRKRDA